jgi:hypothetical protein
MSVIIPIYKIRLGRSKVNTPDLILEVTDIAREDHIINGILGGYDDLILSVLSARNGEAYVNDQWVKFEIQDLGGEVEVKCEEAFKLADAFA